MSKPKDRTGEFMRQHKRILEERTTLIEKVETLETNQAAAIAKAVAEHVDQGRILSDEVVRLVKRNTELAQTNASQHDCIEAMKTQLADRAQDIVGLAKKLNDTAPEFKYLEESHAASLEVLEKIHNTELAALRADVARMDELGARIEERGKKKEQEEARAILNRKVMAQAVPGRNYRG